MIPFVQTKSGLTVYLDGEAICISSDNANYEKIFENLVSSNPSIATLKSLLDFPQYVSKYTGGLVTIEGDEVKYFGTVVHNSLTVRILDLMKKNKSIDYLVNFMNNLMLNPSYRAVNGLFDFLENCSLPITPDGCFLAYKKVDKHYQSIHPNPDGTKVDNSIGARPKMSRNLVNEDPEQTCAEGLHCCSFKYLRSYGNSSSDRVIIVKVNPKDVVSVPKDYNNQKMRVCEYEVVSEVPNDRETELKDKYTTDTAYPSGAFTYTTSQTQKSSTSSSKVAGDWECCDRCAVNRGPVKYYHNMTAGQAKYAYAKEFGSNFTNVRIRKLSDYKNTTSHEVVIIFLRGY